MRQRLNVINQIAVLEEKHRTDMIKLDEQAIAQQQQIWTQSLGTIENAFNSQLRGEPVNAPIIFEPPSSLVGATAQIWIAASGGSGGAADPNWGGCNVWLSSNGTSYVQAGTIIGPAAQGVLTAALSASSGFNPDTTDALAVNMAESGGILASATDTDAQLANTLCIVDSELVSYATATLTAAHNYSLTYLYRGLFGTAIALHAAGAPFAFLNSGAIFKYDLPAQHVGREIYVKLQSFNVFGGGVQNISACAAYTYTPSGAAFDHPVARSWMTGAPLDMGLVTTTPGVMDDFGSPLALAVELDVDLGGV